MTHMHMHVRDTLPLPRPQTHSHAMAHPGPAPPHSTPLPTPPGANIIPLDIYHSTRTPSRLANLISDAAAAHMNMLRLWGGGLPYFPDHFYDLCDETGILVWQEASFACALYPRDDAFLAEVRLCRPCFCVDVFG